MMKLLLISLICVFTALTPKAKATSFHSEGAPIDSTSVYSAYFYTPNLEAPVFRLFPTTNAFVFIKLNTRNGQMWQFQFASRKGKSFEEIMNGSSLVAEEKEENGRFILYPTQNVSIFILLDQLDGRMWQVQWSTVFRDSYIIPIE
jgi:ABC-type uncharacterized transport system permease subunit